MPHPTGAKQTNGRLHPIRSNPQKMQHQLPLHNLAVPPLAHRKRLPDTEIENLTQLEVAKQFYSIVGEKNNTRVLLFYPS
jgi:hypothetical protein